MWSPSITLKSLFASPRVVTIILLLLIPYLYLQRRRLQKQNQANDLLAKQHNCQPAPKLHVKWPLGLDHVYKIFEAANAKHLLRYFIEVTERAGPTFEQTLLGQATFGTVEPRVIEAVLGGQFTKFGLGDRPQVFAPLLGSGIFTQDGDNWKRSRELLRPLFLSNRSDNFLQIQEHVENLIACIPSGKVVDFQPLFFRFTLDTTTYLLFGRSVNSLRMPNPLSEAFAESFRVSQDFLAKRARIGPFYWLIGGRKFRQACATVHEFIDSTIEEALAESSQKRVPSDKLGSDYGLLGTLIQEIQNPKVLRDQLLNMLLAGRDTTACCLTWTMRLLAKHQDILAKLRQEIKMVVGLGPEARQPNRTDLKKMTYLTYVEKEVLRLYPSVPVNSRGCVETTILPTGGGPNGTSPIMVKKGQAVGYCVYIMHRRKDLYGSDADVFRPERWDPHEDNEVNLKNIGWGYLPFNGGPRVCLGQEFALLEVSYTIVRLLQNFNEFEYDPANEMVEVGDESQDVTLVLSSSHGCHIRAVR